MAVTNGIKAVRHVKLSMAVDQ